MRKAIALALLLACCTPAPSSVPGPAASGEAPAPTPTPVLAPSASSAPVPVTGPLVDLSLAPGAVADLNLGEGGDLLMATLRTGEGSAPLKGAAGPLRGLQHVDRPLPARGGRALLEARALGDAETFWVNRGDFDEATDAARRCQRVAIRDGVHLYADLEAKGDPTRLAGLLDTFVTETRPKLEAVYGKLEGPWAGTGEVALVISPAVDDFGARKGALAYFWARDVMPEQPRSNRVAAIFASDDLLRRPAVVRRAVLAHETTHLLAFARKSMAAGAVADEADWVDEGLATAGPDLVGAGFGSGYPHTAEDLADFEAAPESEGLMDWFTGKPGVSYGRAWTVVRYARERFGDTILRDLVAAPGTGQAAWEAALALRSTTFADFATDWARAVALACTPGAAPLGASYSWAWRGPALIGADGGVTLPGFGAGAFNGSLPRPWGLTVRRLLGEGPWRLKLQAPADTGLKGFAVVIPREVP